MCNNFFIKFYWICQIVRPKLSHPLKWSEIQKRSSNYAEKLQAKIHINQSSQPKIFIGEKLDQFSEVLLKNLLITTEAALVTSSVFTAAKIAALKFIED